MDPILDMARRHQLKVIEDCAHSLGATYKGRMVGTLGDASFFSFQAFKPLNTYGGGLAWVRDADLARRVGEFADREQWPTEERVEKILSTGYWQHTFIRPKVFTYSLFPIWWAASWVGAHPEKRLWEGVRPLDPLPPHYGGRFSNVQAAMGLAGLEHLAEFIDRTRRHAKMLDEILGDTTGVVIPRVPPDRTHVYYQYCAYVPDRDATARDCIRRGVDVETLHVDVCTRLDMFGTPRPSPGADRGAQAVQLPVYESLTDDQITRVAQVVVESLTPMAPTSAPQVPQSQP